MGNAVHPVGAGLLRSAIHIGPIVVLLAFLFPPGLAAADPLVHKAFDDLFLADSQDRFFYTYTNCCGLVAAYVVSNKLGVTIDVQSLSKQMPVSHKGTSMEVLATCLESNKLSTLAVGVDAQGLQTILQRNPDIAAIALVRPGHWISMFANDDGTICYDYPTWRAVHVDAFSSVFAKQALLVSRSPLPGDLSLRHRSRWRAILHFATGAGGTGILLFLLSSVIIVDAYPQWLRKRKVRRPSMPGLGT